MFHRPECQRYRQWKREEAKKLLGPRKIVKKKKRKQPITDCIEEEEEDDVTKAILKIKSRKCKKKKKRKPKPLRQQLAKQVSLAELLLKSIQPSIEVRELLLNPRHIACLQDTGSKMDVALETKEVTRTSLPSQPRSTRYRRRIRQRRRPIARKPITVDQKADQEEGKAEDETEEKPKDEKEEKPKDETEEKPKDETPSGSKADKRVKGERRRRKVWRRKVEKKKTSEEDSECDSICSFDSEVCLAGLKLTTEDKIKIEEYQRQTEDTKSGGKD